MQSFLIQAGLIFFVLTLTAGIVPQLFGHVVAGIVMLYIWYVVYVWMWPDRK